MDISKASNFERFVYDLVGQDPERVKRLWSDLADGGQFDLSDGESLTRARALGFCSGRSTHSDRIATIRDVREAYGLVIDPHTADGFKVGRELRDPSVPLICLETALPTKFEDTIREALGVVPERPIGFEDLESREQHYDVMGVDAEALKRYIDRRVSAT